MEHKARKLSEALGSSWIYPQGCSSGLDMFLAPVFRSGERLRSCHCLWCCAAIWTGTNDDAAKGVLLFCCRHDGGNSFHPWQPVCVVTRNAWHQIAKLRRAVFLKQGSCTPTASSAAGTAALSQRGPPMPASFETRSRKLSRMSLSQTCSIVQSASDLFFPAALRCIPTRYVCLNFVQSVPDRRELHRTGLARK